MATYGLSNFLSDVGSLVTAAISWMGDVWDFLVDNPILLVLVLGVPLIGLAISLIQRLFRIG